MDALAHHLIAIYALGASILIPLLIVSIWRFLVKRQYRKAQEAMRRGNQLHRKWLDASKNVDERPGEQ